MRGWLQIDLIRLLVLAAPTILAHSAVVTWAEPTVRPAWLTLLALLLVVSCLLLWEVVRRDRLRALGRGYLSAFVVFIFLFALADDLDLFAGPRRALQGFEQERPRNLFGLGWLGDWRYRFAPRRPAVENLRIVLLPPIAEELDDFALERTRRRFAGLIHHAAESGARGIALDFYFTRSSAEDRRLAEQIEAVSENMPVVFGLRLNDNLTPGSLPPALEGVVPKKRRGHLQGYLEADGKIRLLPARMGPVQTEEVEAFSLVIAELMQGKPAELPGKRLLRFVAPADEIPVMDYDPDSKKWKSAVNGNFLIVGSTSEKDRFDSPFGSQLGVMYHAWAVHSLVKETYLIDVDPRLTLPIIFALCYVLTVLYARGFGGKRLVLAATVLSVAMAAAAAIAARERLWLGIGSPLLAVWILTFLMLGDLAFRRARARRSSRLMPSASLDYSPEM